MKAELIDFMGSDLKIANVARVSYDKDASNYLDSQNENLLEFLWEEGHVSPFRHAQLQFRISCPLYVERQLRKHEIGVEVNLPIENMSVNSISGRYVDFSDFYYAIQTFRLQSKDSKQGSGEDLDETSNTIANIIQDDIIDNAKTAYQELIELGVSKEQARSILPLSLETTFIWTMSFLAFIHLVKLRIKKDVQKETRDLVADMLEQVKNMPGNPFKKSLELLERKEEAFIVTNNNGDIISVFTSLRKLKKHFSNKGWIFDKTSLSLQNNFKTLFITKIGLDGSYEKI
jgi:thymidylate synthase (FAD)